MSLANRTLDVALNLLVNAGLEPLIQYTPSATVVAGLVISASPDSGAIVATNSVVQLTVSNGSITSPGTVAVPNVVGLTAQAARDALFAASCSSVQYLWTINAATAGTVLSQSPAAGVIVAPNSTVQLTLSQGPTKVSSTVVVPG